ncbi:MAG TPA: rhodanese-like domain-containing protein [Chloroflexota bacterium]|nr:rhodanese-like domain-containing protein [Chloroflexota bacterium]
MYLKQFIREESGCASYLVGCPREGCGAVVDPQWQIEPYLAAAAAKGLRITHVLETHLHADHLSGARRLAERTGAVIGIHAAAAVRYPHRALQDGETLRLGTIELRVLHTPGHRPEAICLLVADTTRAPEPCAVLTGDTLFIGGVGRPDLGGEARRYAAALYESLFGKLLALPDFVEVYPAHVGGSACGAGLSGATSSTIGFERRYNYAVQPRSLEQFIDLVTTDLPPQPPNFEAIVAKNRGELPVVEPTASPLGPAEVQAWLQQGAIALDTREVAAFGRGHLPGAVNVPLRGPSFGVRVGWVIPVTTPMVLVLEREEDLADALAALAVIGYSNVVGYLAGGVAAWQAAGFSLQPLPQLSVHELRERLRSDPALLLIDVREQVEYDGRHIRGAVHLPFWALPARANELPRDRPLAVICEGGLRSSLGASLLERAGFRDLHNVSGGMAAWLQAGYPTV